jgi:hypothetical protein
MATKGGQHKRYQFTQAVRHDSGRDSDGIAKNHKNVHSFHRDDASKVMSDGPKHSIRSGAFNSR